jgi:nicotinate-nucleotide pyrophosphorylase (carboxylating)
MDLTMTPALRDLIDGALDEDLVGFDVSSATFEPNDRSTARLVAKQPTVVCGRPVVEKVFERLGGEVEWDFRVDEGDHVVTGATLARAEGPTRALLRGERIGLNFMQRMCGIASKTRKYVEALDDPSTDIVDTRKTLPGYRALDKYAVRVGGGRNHRFNLGGGVIVKDNHIAAAGSIESAVERVRQTAPPTLRIEVEIEDITQIDPALDAGADILMLDNMTTETMSRAIARIREHGRPNILIEASGGIEVGRLDELGGLGLDLISCGSLTHSVRAVDISMQF